MLRSFVLYHHDHCNNEHYHGHHDHQHDHRNNNDNSHKMKSKMLVAHTDPVLVEDSYDWRFRAVR